METIIHLFENTLINSLEAALMVVLLLLITMMFRRKLTPVWQYALWLLLIIKLVLPMLPGNMENELRWNLFSIGESVISVDYSQVSNQPKVSNLISVLETDKEDFSILTNEEVGTGSDLLAIKIASLVWLLGIAAVVLYIMIGYIKISVAMWNEDRTAVPSQLHDLFASIRRDSGVRANVSLRLTSLVSSPTLFGLFSPIVLIPKHLVGQLNVSEWECILRHELSHYKRGDIWINITYAMLTSLHWFNPAIWYAMHRMRIDQEIACDTTVLAVSGLKETYATCIIKMLEIGSSQRTAAASVRFSGYKNQLVRRIVMIRSFEPTKKRVSFIGISTLIAVALFALPSAFAKEEKIINQSLISETTDLKSFHPNDEQRDTEALSSQLSEDVMFIAPTSGMVTSSFGYQTHPKSLDKTLHDGIDIANEEGTDVYAAASGNVIKAEYDGKNGFTVVIEHNDSWQSEYRHLAEFSIKEGENVQSGELIGLMGSTGQSTGPHLHFSILKGGEYVDPISLIEE